MHKTPPFNVLSEIHSVSADKEPAEQQIPEETFELYNYRAVVEASSKQWLPVILLNILTSALMYLYAVGHGVDEYLYAFLVTHGIGQGLIWHAAQKANRLQESGTSLQFRQWMWLFRGIVWYNTMVSGLWYVAMSNADLPDAVWFATLAGFLNITGAVVTVSWDTLAGILCIPGLAIAITYIQVIHGNPYLAIAVIALHTTAFSMIKEFNKVRIINFEVGFKNTQLVNQLNLEKQRAEVGWKMAKTSNEAKTRFLAAASHDLRQPIHALGLFFAELSDQVYSPETALVIGHIEDSIASINAMLNALLDVSKLDAGVIKPSIESVTLSDMFSLLQREFEPVAIENQNELHFDTIATPVVTDPVLLERILRNLIGNALRFTQGGQVLISSSVCDQSVTIQVQDNGIGIPEDQIEEIFTEFHQLQNPGKDRRQGLGLGLAIVKRLANLLDHELQVVSEVGQGACFSITLPVAQIHLSNAVESSGEDAVFLNDMFAGCLVLVLDDDRDVLDGMRGLLTRWGCRVLTAINSNEVEEHLDAFGKKVDLMIFDYRLSEHISGIELAKSLQNRLSYRLAVLVITGDTAPERLREAEASGYPLLHKPVSPAKLRSTMHFLLSSRNRAEN
jgi:signal transduction histidine kinase